MPALRILFVLGGAILGVFYPFVSAILDERGFSPPEIGLTTALAAVGFTLAVPVWGHLADMVVGRVAALRAGVIGASIAVLGLLLGVSPPVVALLIVAFAVFESSLAPLADALAVNALSGAPRAYARVRLLSSLGFASASILAGRLYNETGYGPASLLFAVAAVGIVVVTRWVPDVGRFRLPPPGAAGPAGPSASSRRRFGGGSFGLALRTQPRLRGLLLGLGLVHVGMLAGFTFLALRILDLGGQPSDVALSAGISAFAEIPAMALVPRIAARTSMRSLLVGGLLLYGLTMASWAFLADPGLIVASRLVSGVAFAGISIGAVMTIAALLPPELQATGQGLYQTVGFGVAAVVANALGGIVYGTGGAMPLFLGCAVLAAIGALVTWRAIPASAPAARMAARQEG
ncbi:MAG TPA: MFS transporter [Candidatus Limnocylindrales bacterium]|nr:MFS transporter [Candidatus Limnocylindrales bacterium]